MSRGGRFTALLATGAIVALGLTGCSLLPGNAADPDPTEDPLSAACLVGRWHQTEGWQRLDIDDDSPIEIRLISGGRDLTIKADGTASSVYTTLTRWQGSNATDTLEATFEGTATLTYEADQGAWSDVTDATKVVTNLTLNGTKDTPRTGQAGRTFEGTYRCSSTDLVLSSDDYRQAFQRA